MIRFNEVTPADRESIIHYTLASTNRSCDYSFANICSWRFLYHTEWAEYRGFLLLRFRMDGHIAYMLPAGRQDGLTDVIKALTEEARTEGESLLLTGIDNTTKNELEELMPDTFTFSANRDYADYIYLRESLATLRGKALQSKRNHVNKFMRLYPDHVYHELTPDLVPECLTLADLWCKENGCCEKKALADERQSMNYALTHFEELGITGGILRVNGHIAAFTYGCPINADTFDVCVEKADTAIEGAYAKINQEFAAHLPEQYTYLNREEDLGLEGLRKAKLSYQPFCLLDKYNAYLI